MLYDLLELGCTDYLRDYNFENSYKFGFAYKLLPKEVEGYTLAMHYGMAYSRDQFRNSHFNFKCNYKIDEMKLLPIRIFYTDNCGFDMELYPEDYSDLDFIINRLKTAYTCYFLDATSRVEHMIQEELDDIADPPGNIRDDPESLKKSNEESLATIEKIKREIGFAYCTLDGRLSLIERKQQKLREALWLLYDRCIKEHGTVGSYYQRGMISFSNGDYSSAFFDIRDFIDQGGSEEHFSYQMLGETQIELGLFNEAIHSLSKAIDIDPKKKETYLFRAIAYFEQGNFEKSLDDYLSSNGSLKYIDPGNKKSFDFAKGLITGAQGGGKDAIVELAPSIYSSAKGLAHGLWSFACDPIHVSQDFVDSCQKIIQYLSQEGVLNTLQIVVPEMKELVERWPNLSQEARGEKMGYIIGKYGTDSLACLGVMNGAKYFKNLSRANRVLTIDAIKDAKKAKRIKKVSDQWWEKTSPLLEELKKQEGRFDQNLAKAFRNQNLNETQVRKILHGAGFKTFPRPKGVPNNWVVKIADKSGGMEYLHPSNQHASVRVMPGKSHSPNLNQQKPYIVQKKDGKAFDEYGNLVNQNAAGAHISFDDFVYRE
ncbi:MAG: hypothetical protein K9M07_05015 [Simkaniaceae bacterium]|nr:hypothetical protein [Simkaniaceae bacterium]MCF7852582.1 hypothetical protein [Simkaniaceae bacterium]